MGEEEKEKSALDEQVGGDHYKKLGVQPVEFISVINANFFQGNVIKYVTRYKDKNGIKDLEKAKHYLELMKELKPQTDTKLHGDYIMAAIVNYSTSNNLGTLETDIITATAYKNREESISDENIDIAIGLIDTLIKDMATQVDKIAEFAKDVIGRIHQPAMENKEDEDLTVILDPVKLPKGATIDKLKEVKREILSSVNTIDTETHNWLIENN